MFYCELVYINKTYNFTGSQFILFLMWQVIAQKLDELASRHRITHYYFPFPIPHSPLIFCLYSHRHRSVVLLYAPQYTWRELTTKKKIDKKIVPRKSCWDQWHKRDHFICLYSYVYILFKMYKLLSSSNIQIILNCE